MHRKSISLGLEYCEAKRIDLALKWVYEPEVDKPTATHGGICPVVKLLCKSLVKAGDRVEVHMGDSRQLSKIFKEKSIDLVNVDPPYFNQHFYSDLSEFFWQIIRLSLKPAIEAGLLFNRDESRGPIECQVPEWSPALPIVPRAGEVIVRKTKGKPDVADITHSKEWWREQMWKFFAGSYTSLKDDGRMVVWYTHTDPEAWEAILSGVYASKFLIGKVWIVKTEVTERLISMGRNTFFTSMVFVCQKPDQSTITVGEKNPAKLLLNEQVRSTISSAVLEAIESAKTSGAANWEIFIMALAGAIAGATRVRNPSLELVELPSETLESYTHGLNEWENVRRQYIRSSNYFRDTLYPAALYIGASTVLQGELKKASLSDEQVNLVVGADDLTKAYLVFWVSTMYREKGREPIVTYDFAEKICKVLGTTINSLENHGLVEKGSQSSHLVLFGKDVLDKFKGKMEIIDRTVASAAIFLLKLIADSPIKDDEEKCAKQVTRIRPANKQSISVALFLLRTACDEDIRKASISPLMKSFVERVLNILYEGR
jgi:hypothetical protein